jgi:hypothetical protein
VVDLALAIARAIERVHSISEEDGTPLSVVHGELAPTSVFVTLDGRPVLTEPSVSHLGGRALRARIEARGGRSGYEAPEQRLRQPIDARTDVFSLGVLIAEMIGGTAFKTADLANLDGLGERIQAKCAARPNTPQLLIDLVHDMTALSPADRPPDMATVVGTLAWLRGRVGEWMDRPKELSGIFGQARSSMLAPAAAAWAAPEPSASPLAERCSEMTVDAIGPPQGLTMPPEEQIAPEVEAFATGGWVISEISEIPDAAADDPPRPADMGNREIAPDPRKRPLEHELANALEAALAEVDRDPDHDEGDPGSQRPPAAALPLTPPLAASPIAKQAMSEAEELDEALSAYERRERMLARAREHARAAVKAEEAAAPPLETPPPSKPRPSAPHLRVVEKQDGDVRDAELPAPVTSQRKRPRLSAVPPPIVDAQGKVPAPPSGNKSVSPWGKSDDEPLFGGSPAWVPPASRPAPGGSSSAPSAPSVSAAGAPAAASSTAPSRRAQRRAKQDPGVPADFQLTFDENDDGEGSKPLVVSSTRADAAISFGDGGPKASVAELASAMQNALADEELLPPEWTQAPRPSVAVPLPGATAGMPKAMPAAEPAPAAAPAPVPPSAKIVRGVPPPATAGAGRSKRAPLGQAPLPRNAPAAGAGAAPATPAAAIPSRPSDAQTLEASMLGAPIADLTPAAPQGKKSLAPPGVGNLQIAPRTQKRILGVAPLIFIAALLGLAGTAYALLWFLFARKPI